MGGVSAREGTQDLRGSRLARPTRPLPPQTPQTLRLRTGPEPATMAPLGRGKGTYLAPPPPPTGRAGQARLSAMQFGGLRTGNRWWQVLPRPRAPGGVRRHATDSLSLCPPTCGSRGRASGCPASYRTPSATVHARLRQPGGASAPDPPLPLSCRGMAIDRRCQPRLPPPSERHARNGYDRACLASDLTSLPSWLTQNGYKMGRACLKLPHFPSSWPHGRANTGIGTGAGPGVRDEQGQKGRKARCLAWTAAAREH